MLREKKGKQEQMEIGDHPELCVNLEAVIG